MLNGRMSRSTGNGSMGVYFLKWEKLLGDGCLLENNVCVRDRW